MLKFIESDPWVFAIVTGVLVSLLWAVLARTTKWAGPAAKGLGLGVLAVLRWIVSIRVTTEPRIRRRIARQVQKALTPPPDMKYWRWARDSRPRVWRLENHRGEPCTVVDILFDNDSGWSWSAPSNLPIRVRDGGYIEIRGAISVNAHRMYMSDNPGATVTWADSHGDEDVIWTPFKDGQMF